MIRGLIERFFTPRLDFRILAAMRIAFSVLLLVNILVLIPDLEPYFSESGMLPYDASRAVVDPDTVSIFDWLPQTSMALWTTYGLLVAATVSLLLGLGSRISALVVFVLLTSFHHRNMILFDAEDTVFRLFAAFFVVAHAGRAWSLDARLAGDRSDTAPTWPIRLFQVQVSVIYLSAGLLKTMGAEWRDGTALYYVARLDDLFGQAPLPDFMFEWMPLVRVMSWSVVVLELSLPFALWFERTRRPALVLAFLLHVSIEYAMNLFLFHWIMLVGLLAFTRAEDWRALSRSLKKGVRRPSPLLPTVIPHMASGTGGSHG